MDGSLKTKLSPSAVAKQWGVGKTTVYRMMKDGELSYETNVSGKRELDLSEVVRVLGQPKVRHPTSASAPNVLAVQMLKDHMDRQDKAHSDHIQSLQAQISSYQEQVNKLLENQADTTKLLIHLQDSVGNPSSEIPKTEPADQMVKQKETSIPRSKTETLQPTKRKRSLFQRILSAVVED